MSSTTRIASMGVVLCLAMLAGCQSTNVDQTPNRMNPDGELVLVKDGVSQAPIVIFKDAPPFTRQAADELAEYIERISGAKPKILEGTPDPLPKHAIWVGYQPVLKKLFPNVDFEFKYPEEILITANQDHLAILGRDKWDPNNMTIVKKRGNIEGVQLEYGTANAVYDFLQDFLDVRWIWPGELGVDVVEHKTIAFDPFVFRYHPQIRGRGGIFSYSGVNTAGGYGHSQDWVRHQRLRLDSLPIQGGHGFGDWWEKYHVDHPEYFALQPDGTRSGFPSARCAKMCQSNPEVWDVWLANAAEQLKNNPNQIAFNGSPNDSWASGHCVCDGCLAWDHPDGKMRRYHWEGLGQEHVAMSDRHVTFANHLARKLKERYPDKDYDVYMLSYGNSRPAPVEARPDDNVIISSVANFLISKPGQTDRGSLDGETFQGQYGDWAKLAPRLIWRPNTGSPAGWQQAQLDVPFHQVADHMRFVGDNNCVGIYVDKIWEHWGVCGPLYYLMGQMAWNPNLDSEEILADYYKRAFGPAAKTMEKYWNLAENARDERVIDGLSYAEVHDDDFFDEAYGLLDEANRQVADAPKKYADRIRFVRAGLDHTRWMAQIRQWMAEFKKSECQDKELERKILANWEKIENNCKEFPLAIQWGPIRPQTPRMAGLHPDHLTKKKKVKKKKKTKSKANDLL